MRCRVFGHRTVPLFGIGCLCALKLAGASLGLWEICIIWGLGISLAVYLTAGISGAHLNPAVTIALWLFAAFPARKVLPYCVAQLAGPLVEPFWRIFIQQLVYRF